MLVIDVPEVVTGEPRTKCEELARSQSSNMAYYSLSQLHQICNASRYNRGPSISSPLPKLSFFLVAFYQILPTLHASVAQGFEGKSSSSSWRPDAVWPVLEGHWPNFGTSTAVLEARVYQRKDGSRQGNTENIEQ